MRRAVRQRLLLDVRRHAVMVRYGAGERVHGRPDADATVRVDPQSRAYEHVVDAGSPPAFGQRVSRTARYARELDARSGENRVKGCSPGACAGPEPLPHLEIEVACDTEFRLRMLAPEAARLAGLRRQRLTERGATAHGTAPCIAAPRQYRADHEERSRARLLNSHRCHPLRLRDHAQRVRG